MRIGELAARTHVGVSTLRAWERRFALFEPRRSPAGHRLYDERDVERVNAVVRLLGEGLTLPTAVARVAASGPGAIPGGEGTELLFARALEVANKGVWVVRDRRTRYANRRTAEIMRHSIDELLATDVLEFFDPEELELVRERAERVRDGERISFTQRLRRGDGSTFVAEIDTSPLFDQHGRYDGAVCVIEDVTERIGADARTLLQGALLDLVGDPALATRPDGAIALVNSAAVALLGWPADELLGRPVREISAGVDELLRGTARSRLASGQRVTRRHRLLRADGSELAAEVVAGAALGDDGTIVGYVATLRRRAGEPGTS
jgi:PAS domain S-box-containing protein